MSVEKFIILPDVTCELNADLRKQYDIDVIFGEKFHGLGDFFKILLRF